MVLSMLISRGNRLSPRVSRYRDCVQIAATDRPWLTQEQVLKAIEASRPNAGKFNLKEHLMGGVSCSLCLSASDTPN